MTGFENWNALVLLALTKGEVEMASVPTEAFSSSTVDTVPLSGARGLILILNFFPGSSSPSDSLDEKNILALAGGGAPLRNTGLACFWMSSQCSPLYYTCESVLKIKVTKVQGLTYPESHFLGLLRVPCTQSPIFSSHSFSQGSWDPGNMKPWEQGNQEHEIQLRWTSEQ